jgi:hypothetical protein
VKGSEHAHGKKEVPAWRPLYPFLAVGSAAR